MANFIELTGYKGEKLLLNVATVEVVHDVKMTDADVEEIGDKRALSTNAVVKTASATIPVQDTYESIVRRLEA